MSTSPIRVLCVDDHAFLVDGLRARFALEKDIACIGRLSSADGLAAEVQRLRPNIVLLDIEMPGADPFEAAAEVRRLEPEARVVFLSAYVRDHYISSAFQAGAWGYFSKSDETEAIIQGLRRVAAGEFAFGPKVQERCQPLPPRESLPRAERRGAGVRAPASRLDALTAREREVLRLIGKGMSRAEIARVICRSPKTVDGHREKIMQKLDIHDRGELVHFAIREGLVEA
jgi:DNA-binding NarL/FixJ family response regulator